MAEAYSARAAEYFEFLGTMSAVAPADIDLVNRWSANVTGKVLDLGCGPGHWAAHLADRGKPVVGIDPSRQFIRLAREKHPDLDLREGGTAWLEQSGERFDGILAWYSLIHVVPSERRRELQRVAAALRPGGSLLMGFFDGESTGAFEHAVTTAYWWPREELVALMRTVGLRVEEVHHRCDPGARPHGAVLATRDGSSRVPDVANRRVR